MKKFFLFCMASSMLLACIADEVFDDFESLNKWKVLKKGKFNKSFEKVSGLKNGGAIKIMGPGVILMKVYPYNHKKRLDWDKKYKGLSFWVKGDGSNEIGTISIGSAGWNYAYCFLLKDKEWKQYTVAWEDFVPFWHMTQKLNASGSLPVSGITFVRLGDSWLYTHKKSRIPQFSYCIDNLQLVESAEPSAKSQAYKVPDLDKVLDKLKKGKPLSIVCLGDSITAGVGVLKPYPDLLQEKLRKAFNTDNITVKNYGVGGIGMRRATVWLNRDFDQDFGGELPDIATIMIGYNDKSLGTSSENFTYMYKDFIDKFVAKTKGKVALLLIPTIPGNLYRFSMQDDYAQVVRNVARERKLPICDGVDKAFKAIGKKEIGKYFRDAAHPNAKGQELFADNLARFFIKKAK